MLTEKQRVSRGDVNFTNWVVRFSDITKICPSEGKQIYTRQFNIVLVSPSRQVSFCFRTFFSHNYLPQWHRLKECPQFPNWFPI